MNKTMITFFCGATILLWNVEGQALVVQNQQMISSPASQVIGRPIHPSHVDLDAFHARHPESIPQKHNYTCPSLLDPHC